MNRRLEKGEVGHGFSGKESKESFGFWFLVDYREGEEERKQLAFLGGTLVVRKGRDKRHTRKKGRKIDPQGKNRGCEFFFSSFWCLFSGKKREEKVLSL